MQDRGLNLSALSADQEVSIKNCVDYQSDSQAS